jgi:hypothetical protein
LVSFHFVSISLISFRFVSFSLISFRFVSFRFYFVSHFIGTQRYSWVSERITNKRKILRRSGEGEKGRGLP